MELIGSYDARRNRLIDRQIARTEFICDDNAQELWTDGQELMEGKDFLLEMVKDEQTSLWYLQITPIRPERQKRESETDSAIRLKHQILEMHKGI